MYISRADRAAGPIADGWLYVDIWPRRRPTTLPRFPQGFPRGDRPAAVSQFASLLQGEPTPCTRAVARRGARPETAGPPRWLPERGCRVCRERTDIRFVRRPNACSAGLAGSHDAANRFSTSAAPAEGGAAPPAVLPAVLRRSGWDIAM